MFLARVSAFLSICFSTGRMLVTFINCFKFFNSLFWSGVTSWEKTHFDDDDDDVDFLIDIDSYYNVVTILNFIG